MIKFYYNPSPNPAKVALFLEESGLPYEVVPIDTRKGEQFAPSFVAINPNSKTPAITDGDVRVFDSNAILLYLAEKTQTSHVPTPRRRVAVAGHASWFALAAALLAAAAQAAVPNDPTQVEPLAVGTRAPQFSAQTKDGELRTFSPDRYQKPTIVLFYRGGWCPYCNSQLSDLRLVEPKLRQSGYEIVFLSTDRPAILYSSLKAENIHYTLLSDSRLEAATAFHIAYHVDDATLADMKKYGVDLDSSTGESLHELPVPSVFIIDKTGIIRYVYSNPDYKIRLGADALWAAAQPYAVK